MAFLEVVGQTAMKAGQAIGHGVTVAAQKVGEGAKVVAEKAVEIGKVAAEKIGEGTKVVAEKAAELGKEAAQKVGEGFKNIAQESVELGKTASEKVGNGIKNSKNLIDDATTYVKEARAEFHDIAKDIRTVQSFTSHQQQRGQIAPIQKIANQVKSHSSYNKQAQSIIKGNQENQRIFENNQRNRLLSQNTNIIITTASFFKESIELNGSRCFYISEREAFIILYKYPLELIDTPYERDVIFNLIRQKCVPIMWKVGDYNIGVSLVCFRPEMGFLIASRISPLASVLNIAELDIFEEWFITGSESDLLEVMRMKLMDELRMVMCPEMFNHNVSVIDWEELCELYIQYN